MGCVELPRLYLATTLKCVITVADCCHVHGRGADGETAGVKHAEVIAARIVQDERGWLRLAT